MNDSQNKKDKISSNFDLSTISRFVSPQDFNVDQFFQKLKKYAKKAGVKLVYAALIGYQLTVSEEVPLQVKLSIWGALAYFVLPVDLVPDFIPLAGYGDDLAAVLLALSVAKGHITPAILADARKQLEQWFGPVSDQEIDLGL